jgi:hypothetical protein
MPLIVAIALGVIILISTLNQKAMLTKEKKSIRVGKFVDTEHVDSVIRNYKQDRWAHNSKRIGKEDSLSVWYSLEELEEFLAKSKEQGADGIRLYFGVYPDDFKERPVCAGRQSVVFVATRQKEKDNVVSNKDIYISGDRGNTILAYNMGVPCPPLCSSDGIGISILDKGEGCIVV